MEGGRHPTPMRGPLMGLAWLAAALQAAFFGAPLLFVIWLSLQAPADASTLPAGAWGSVFASPQARLAIFNSVILAGLTALLAAVFAVPLAYLVGVRGRRIGRITLALLLMMWFFDPGMRILGWMQAFKDLALLDFVPSALLAGFPAEITASLHAWLPPATLLLAFGFAGVDRKMLDAARECGATSAALLRRIVLPLNYRLLAFTAALVFCGSIGSFLEPRLLGSGDFEQATEWLQRALESETGWPYAAVMLLLLLLIAILPLAAFGVRIRRRRKAVAA